MAIGNTEAIRDWMIGGQNNEAMWYTKDEIDSIITLYNNSLYDVDSPYYSKDAGSVCTAGSQECTKTADGESYNGILYAYPSNHNSYWVAFCISLSQDTAKAMSYRYGRIDGSIYYKGRTWYYSTDSLTMNAYGANRDGTDPASRRFNYREGNLNVPEWLMGLLDTMNTHY